MESIMALHVLPCGDAVTRARLAACSRQLARKAAGLPDGAKVRARWAADRLSAAGAPPGVTRRLDARALRWMEKRDLAHGGQTGYIDYLSPRDFGSKPVLYGQDPGRRFFLAVSFVWRGRTGLACLFQRYSDDSSFFVNCPDCLSEGVFSSNLSGGRLSEHHADILELVSCGMCTLPSGETVYLTA
jgi:hypothetical protein